jgi:8-oxo-dGTP pyrophosphatase MutT (NUDIX family)
VVHSSRRSEPAVPAIPRDAATLILLRPAAPPAAGTEVLMLRRHAGSAFMPGAYVFPGGVVEESDYAPGMERLCRGLTSVQAFSDIPDAMPPEKALGFFVAAVREAFEEAGILMACGESSCPLAMGQELGDRLARHRPRVHRDPRRFASMLAEESLRIAADSLFYFDHWITPEASPIRFDARFFVAAAPEDQEASSDDLETTAALWIAPQALLEAHHRGDLYLPVPTLASVTILTEFSSVELVIASARIKAIRVNYG